MKLAVQYQALTDGYVDGFVPRKLRSVLKGIVQSISPCLNARDMNCATCPFHNECCYFNLMVEKREQDFLPYFIHAGQNGDFHGRITAGDRHAFHIGIIGEKIGFAEHVGFALRRKPYIFLNGIRGEKTHFQVSSIERENNGKPINLNDLMDRCVSRFPGDLSRIHRITLDFVSPLSITYGGKTLTEPEEMNFRIFHAKLLHRIEDLALYHCGAAECAGSGRASDFESEHNIKTLLHKDFRFVRSIAYKTFPNGRKAEEKIGGFKGRISFEGNLTSVFPLIVLGEALHLGNDTTQGLGRYCIVKNNREG